MEERKTQRKTKAELKEMIINLRMQNIALQIPKGNCVYAYFGLKDMPDIDCENVNCDACKQQFFKLKRQEIAETVSKY